MKASQLLTLGIVVLAVGCADDRGVLDPTAPDLARGGAEGAIAEATGPTQVAGRFDAVVDFSTLTLTPRGTNCLLQVAGALIFSGTIQGTATGRTSALVFASCAEVATTPPGTYRDVFRSELLFEGTVDGEPARARVLYLGSVEQGGRIDGRLVFHDGIEGMLDVDAVVAVGGSYEGSVVVH